MSIIRDWFNWLGGFPFEVARAQNILGFVRNKGFVLMKLKITNGIGNNEFGIRNEMTFASSIYNASRSIWGGSPLPRSVLTSTGESYRLVMARKANEPYAPATAMSLPLTPPSIERVIEHASIKMVVLIECACLL